MARAPVQPPGDDEPDAVSGDAGVPGRGDRATSQYPVYLGVLVSELQVHIGELKQAVSGIESRNARSDARMEVIERNTGDLRTALERNTSELRTAIERNTSELRSILAKLEPKIEDVNGFVKHGVPHLARKEDLASLRYEIEKRPTRRQAIFDIAWINGLLITAITFGARLVH